MRTFDDLLPTFLVIGRARQDAIADWFVADAGRVITTAASLQAFICTCDAVSASKGTSETMTASATTSVRNALPSAPLWAILGLTLRPGSLLELEGDNQGDVQDSHTISFKH